MTDLRDPSPLVYPAIRGVMQAMGHNGIAKNHRNKEQRFDFRGIDDVYGALNKALVDNDLLMLPRVVERTLTQRQAKSGGTLFCVALKLEIDLVSVADGSKHTISAYGEGMDSGDKATSKAESIAFKYAAFQTFCIPVDGIPDADADKPEEALGEAAGVKLIRDALFAHDVPETRVLQAYGVRDVEDLPLDKHAEILARITRYPKRSGV